jgi:hypothetical protein
VQLISYKGTSWIKRSFWLGAIAMIAIASIPPVFHGGLRRDFVESLVPVFILCAFWFYFLRKSKVHLLADEVFDCGDHLIVRRGKTEESVPFSNISAVGVSTNAMSGISMRLLSPMGLGETIEFLPAYVPKSKPWSVEEKNRVAAELGARADRARGGRSA